MKTTFNWSLCMVVLASSLGPAWANTQANPPVCFTNRFGVEQCGYGEGSPPPNSGQTRTRALTVRPGCTAEGANSAACAATGPKVAEYCAQQKSAGPLRSDGLCAVLDSPR
ncbi:MAG: hypothetical protein OHK0048_01930 [Rhodoferax sp.]